MCGFLYYANTGRKCSRAHSLTRSGRLNRSLVKDDLFTHAWMHMRHSPRHKDTQINTHTHIEVDETHIHIVNAGTIIHVCTIHKRLHILHTNPII